MYIYSRSNFLQKILELVDDLWVLSNNEEVRIVFALGGEGLDVPPHLSDSFLLV